MTEFSILPLGNFSRYFLLPCKSRQLRMPSLTLYLTMIYCRFLLSVHYTHYEGFTFFINLACLVINLIGKLPYMHTKRMFGINAWESDVGPQSTTAH